MFETKPKPPPLIPTITKMAVDVRTLNFDELCQLKRDLDHELTARSEAEMELLKGKLAIVAAAQGIAIPDLFQVKKERKKRGPNKKKTPEPEIST